MFKTLLDAVPMATEPNTMDMIKSFLPFILIIVVFYFFMIRPQQKRQKELNKFRDELKKGDHVITTGGIFAKVIRVEEAKVTLEIAEGVYVDFDKSAILSSAEQKN